MKVIKIPDKYDVNLFCKDNISKSIADRIVEESIKCPFCGKDNSNIFLRNLFVDRMFMHTKKYMYSECRCEYCGAKWQSDEHEVIDNSDRIIAQQIRSTLHKIYPDKIIVL